MKRVCFVKVISIATLGSVFAPTAFACLCGIGYLPNVPEKFEDAAIVFRATVTDVEILTSRIKLKEVGWVDRERRVAWFEVIETYKGDPMSVEAVATPTTAPACGIPLNEGDEYIFFADEIGQVTSCGGSRSRQSVVRFGYDWDDFLKSVESQQ